MDNKEGRINITIQDLLAKVGELTMENQYLYRRIKELQDQAIGRGADKNTEDDGK